MTTNTNTNAAPFRIDACEEAFVRDFCPYKGNPDPLVVWRAAWESALSNAAQPPAVVGEKFQRAWLQLDELPGGMMIGPEGRYGPVPGSCSAWVTTSERERDRCRAEGGTMLEVWLAAAPKAAKAEPQKQTMAEFLSQPTEVLQPFFEEALREVDRAQQEVLDATATKAEAEPVQQPAAIKPDDLAYREACSLARSLFKKHFAHEPHYASGEIKWDVCDSTAGVISQIDNMVCELVHPDDRAPRVPLTADDLREPKNGANWRVQWWSESARLMLPANKRLDSFQSYKNGTLMFTLKEHPND